MQVGGPRSSNALLRGHTGISGYRSVLFLLRHRCGTFAASAPRGAWALDDEQEWELWRTWLSEEPKNPSIYQDVISMYASRAIWWGFNTIYSKAPEEARTNATFQNWIASSYFTSQALGIGMDRARRNSVNSSRNSTQWFHSIRGCT